MEKIKVFSKSESAEFCMVDDWEPNEEELEYIKKCINNNEKPKIYLSILGITQPPVWVGCNLYKGE